MVIVGSPASEQGLHLSPRPPDSVVGSRPSERVRRRHLSSSGATVQSHSGPAWPAWHEASPGSSPPAQFCLSLHGRTILDEALWRQYPGSSGSRSRVAPAALQL
eukprot:5345627-Prymnesium_polylepis.1